MLKRQACACFRLDTMGISKIPAPFLQRFAAVALGATVAALSGCYVVPLDTRTGQPAAAYAPPPPPAPGPVNFPVRLYPANEAASRHGVVMALVTNDLHGKGSFSANIGGESFTGEATRRADASRSGVANGAGNRGSYLACSYTMNNASQGTGQCRLSDGAVFSLHMGQ